MATETDSIVTGHNRVPPISGFNEKILYAALGEKRPSGQEIKSILEDRYEMEINHGRLYPNLDKLIDHGFINKGKIDKRTNYYEVTSRGQQYLKEEQEWEKSRL